MVGLEDGDPAIRIRGLAVRYGAIQALDHLDLDIPRGGVALLGPNGAGKSSTLKAILGFVRPVDGSIRIYGAEVGRSRQTLRRRIGYMPERDAFLAGLTGFRAVALAGELSGLPRREAYMRAHEVLHYAGLGEARYRPVDTYSTGMRQRVKLAQALVHDPPLLFLDEPTNGLDPPGRAEMLGLIRDLTTNHAKDVILSTHILPDAERTVDWVAIMNGGKLVNAGPRTTLIPTAESASFDVHVHGDIERVGAGFTARHIEGDLAPNGTGMLRLPAGGETALIFSAVAEAGGRVIALRPRQPRLEDVFFEALGENE